MIRALTLTGLQNMLWELRGRHGCGDGSSWPQLQMLLLEELEPDVAAALLSRVRAELLANATHQRMLAQPESIGPNTQRLLTQLLAQAPAPRRQPQQQWQPRTNGLERHACICDRCGALFQQTGRGRPRLRCFDCSPPAR